MTFHSFVYEWGRHTISKLISEVDKDSRQHDYAIESVFDEDYWTRLFQPKGVFKKVKYRKPPWFNTIQTIHLIIQIANTIHTIGGRDFPHTCPLLIPFKSLPPNTEITFDYNKTSNKNK